MIKKGNVDMIKTVIKSQNNMVIVFDRKGKQIPKYQGQYGEVKEGILKDAPIDTVFAHGFTYTGRLQKVPKEEW